MGPGALITRFASRLRFPQLFVVTLVVFLFDLVFPDFVPFIDEALLALTTLLLGSWKKPDRPPGEAEAKPPIKDVTPRDGG